MFFHAGGHGTLRWRCRALWDRRWTLPEDTVKQADATTVSSPPQARHRRLVGNALQRRRKMIAFGWYGGKYVHLGFILPHLPTDAGHFCDVYGGSAAVLINQPQKTIIQQRH